MSSYRSKKLNLPYIAPAQARKHITHNEAIRLLDSIVHLSVVSDNLSEPPLGLTEGAYLLPLQSSAEWSDRGNEIAIRSDAGWDFHKPQIGWICYVQDINCLKIWNGNSWGSLSKSVGLNNHNLEKLGVQATADTLNRFALSSPASLFTHEGDSHRLKINKQSEADTASLILQTDYLTHAEIGLNGSNDTSIKVSSDGQTFQDSIVCDHQSGRVAFPNGLYDYQTGIDVASYVPGKVKEIWRLNTARGATPRNYTVQSINDDILTLSDSVASTIFSSNMQGNAMLRLWNMSKTPHVNCWIKGYVSGSKLQVQNGADIVNWNVGDMLQLGDPVGATGSGLNSLGMVALDISPYIESELGRALRLKAVTIIIRVEAINGVGRLGLSATGESGSATDGYSLSDGKTNTSSFIAPCSVKSPISESNLVYVRELLGDGTSSFGINFLRISGVWI